MKRKRQSPMKAVKEQCGKMARIHKDGKFGFIEATNGDSIFVLPSSCPRKELPPLNARVWFDVVIDSHSKRFRADKVRNDLENDEVGWRKQIRKELKDGRDPVFRRGVVMDLNYRERSGHIESSTGELYSFRNPLVRGPKPISHDRVYLKPLHELDGSLWTDEIEVDEEPSSGE